MAAGPLVYFLLWPVNAVLNTILIMGLQFLKIFSHLGGLYQELPALEVGFELWAYHHVLTHIYRLFFYSASMLFNVKNKKMIKTFITTDKYHK